MLYFCSERPGGLGGPYGDIYKAPIGPIVDFNGDEIVDIHDLVVLIDNWGTSESLCDIGLMPWGDGIVDVQDLDVLMSYWGQEFEFPPFDLLAYWKLDETEGDIAYESAGVNDAVVFGGAVWQPDGGQVGGALAFDGIDDYVSTPFVLNPANGAFRVFAWIKGGTPGQVIVSQRDGANWLCTDSLEGNLMTGLSRPAGDRIRPQPLVSEFVITDGNWHHIGLVWDGAQRILYVDDVEVTRDVGALSALKGSENGLYIGAGSSVEQGTFWSGLIDDVRIYNRAVIP
jgi:hypothetical protein